MEFFNDFNYDDLDEIVLTGGANNNIDLEEEYKKGEEAEKQELDELVKVVENPPAENNLDMKLDFNENMAEQVNTGELQNTAAEAEKNSAELVNLDALPEGETNVPTPVNSEEKNIVVPTTPVPEAVVQNNTNEAAEPPIEEAGATEEAKPAEEAQPVEEAEAVNIEAAVATDEAAEPTDEAAEPTDEAAEPTDEAAETTDEDLPKANSRELDFVKLLQKKTLKQEALLLSELDDITRDEAGVYHTVNQLLQRLESSSTNKYHEALDLHYEHQKKHGKDYIFSNTDEQLTRKTKQNSKRSRETVTITKPVYQRIKPVMEKLTSELNEIEHELKELNSEALDETRKKQNHGKIENLKDDYFKVQEKIKLVQQYDDMVNSRVENKNTVNNSLLQIGKNSAEKRLLFSEINVIVNTLPIDQEALDSKVKKYLSLGNETRELYEKISSVEERQLIDYFIAKEPSVSSKKLKETEADKPKKKKIKVKANDKLNDKSKSKAKPKAGKAKQSGGGTKDKNKSLETVIETIDLLDNSEQEAPEVSEELEGIEADNETKTIVINETESTGEEESPKSELNEIEDDTFVGTSNDTFTDADDDLEEVQLVGGDTEAPSSVNSDVKQFKIDSIDLGDDLDALANYVEEESDASDTESEADFTDTYRENSMDGLDTAEKIPLDIDLNSAQVNKEKEPQIPVVNVVKLGH